MNRSATALLFTSTMSIPVVASPQPEPTAPVNMRECATLSKAVNSGYALTSTQRMRLAQCNAQLNRGTLSAPAIGPPGTWGVPGGAMGGGSPSRTGPSAMRAARPDADTTQQQQQNPQLQRMTQQQSQQQNLMNKQLKQQHDAAGQTIRSTK